MLRRACKSWLPAVRILIPEPPAPIRGPRVAQDVVDGRLGRLNYYKPREPAFGATLLNLLLFVT